VTGRDGDGTERTERSERARGILPSRPVLQVRALDWHECVADDFEPLGAFELVASNKVRSDEETLAEVFNGSAYACEKEVAEDPCFDWVPRKEQIFDEHKLMQLSIWKKEWDADAKCFEPVDLGCADAPSPRTLRARPAAA